jgi:predicted methyltransferase
MNVSDLEDIVSRVALDFFHQKNPGFSAIDNPKSVQTAIEDTAFVINKFISYFNKLAEGESSGRTRS